MLDDLGLAHAIEWALAQQTAAVGWQGVFEGAGADRRFPVDVETACFRIAQEAITNAARYSQACELKVTLRQVASDLELTVTDNGLGFDLEQLQSPKERKKHFGLLSMFDRANLAGGRLDVDTAPGRGTRIHAVFPTTSRARLLHPSCPPHARTLATCRLADRRCALIDDRRRKATPGLRAPAAGGTDLERGARDDHR